MMATEARLRANAKWREKALDRIEINPRKEDGKAIRAAASAAGQSVGEYIMQAVRDRMARDAAQSPENASGVPGDTDTSQTTDAP